MFYLTRNEKGVLFVLAVVLLCGSAIEGLFKYSPEIKKEISRPEKFVYKTNINTADLDQLVSVPYIGEVSARAILRYRKTKGRFDSLEELKDISGIHPSNYLKMIHYLTI